MDRTLELNNRKSHSFTYFLAYTLAFAVLFFFCFGIHLVINRKSLLNYVDSFNMHYNSYIYAGRLFKDFWNTFEFRLWDPNLGYGADTFITIGGYFTDPLYLLTLWIPERFSELAFNSIVVFRLYLAGISFSVLSFKRGNRFYPTLCGAIIYTFSACAYIGLNQSGFLIPLYILPLLVLGADMLYEKKKPTLYVILLAYFAVASFYFVYMFAIMIVCYCLLKWFLTPKAERTIKDLLSKFASFFLYSLWSALIAAFSLIPVAFVMQDMGRLDLRRYVPFLYDLDYYKDFFQGYITSYNMLNRDAMIGSSVLIILCITVLFMLKRRDYLRLKTEIILMTLGLLIPFVGYIFNGMNYPANRWSFFYILVLAYMTTLILPEIPALPAKKKPALIIVPVLYLCLGISVLDAGRSGFVVIASSAVVTGVLFYFSQKIPSKYYGLTCIVVAGISVILPAYFHYSANTSNSMRYLVPAGDGYTMITEENGLSLLSGLEVNDGTRYNHAKTINHYRNVSMLTGTSGTNFYYNMYNNYVDKFHQSIGLNTNPCNFSYDGLDSRSELMSLLGVNYYLINSEPSALPVGYSLNNAVEDQEYKLITSDYRNSLFTLFDQTISEDEFYRLSPAQKQDILMRACVTNTSTDSADVSSSDEVPFTISSLDGDNSVTDDLIRITKAESGFVMSFDSISDAEVYLYIQALDKKEIDPINYFVRIYGQTDGEDIPALHNFFVGATYANHMYGGKHDWMINVGRTTESIDQLRVVFDAPGDYSYECLKLYKRDTASIGNNIASLDHNITNLQNTANRLQLDCTVDKEKHLFIAIPYSKGWTAYDNGQKIEVLHGDIGFMALKLAPGSHHIEMKYETYGLKAGLIISALSLTGFVVYTIIRRKRKDR